MKILILSWRGPGHSNAGGAEVVTWQHAKAWVKAGHQVTLFTSAVQGRKPVEELDGIKVHRQGGQAFGVKWAAWRWYQQQSDGFDLVVDEFHGIPFFTPWYVTAPKLGYIHEVAKEVWGLNPWPKPFNLLPALIGRWLEPWIFGGIYRAVPFMTVSESTKQDLMAWGIKAAQITVIHNGVVLPKKLPIGNRRSPMTVTFFGALSKDKGIEDAMMVFARLSQDHPDWRFWVIGMAEKSYQRQLDQLVARLKLGAVVKFWGYVSESQKFDLLSQSQVVLNPSVREGWGLVVIEAAAVGAPTIGYDVPGLRDSIVDGQTGRLVATNPLAMAKVVEDLLNDPAQYQKLSQQAKAWAKQFEWKTATQASLALVEKLGDSTKG